MALTEDGGVGMTMPVSPMYGGGNGFGFGGDWAWIILLLLLGWGNNGWGNGYGGNAGAGFVDASVQRGFDQSAIMSSLGDIQGAICSGFAGVEASANARQIADMQNSFALQSALSTCCCENRLASADLKYTVATENCADRYEAAQNTRDIIENANRNNQAILDKLCALEIDAKNDKIADLERQLTMANLAASQTAQTSRILADNTAQTVALEQYLNPTPIPAYVVQNPNCCTTTTGCGCGSF
jgi:hypothetical protein